MKKLICFLLSLLLFVATMAGCGHTTLSYKTYVTDISNSADYASIERSMWPVNRCDEAEAPREYTVEFQGKLYTGEYQETRQKRYCSYRTREYSDGHIKYKIREDTDTLAFIRLSKLNYSATESLLEDVVDPEGTAIAIADQVVSEFARPSDYERTVTTDEISTEKNGITYTGTVYEIEYVKHKCGIPTQDMFYITVSSKGNLSSVSIGETGAFDRIPESSIDLTAVSNSVDARVQEIGDDNPAYTYLGHTIKNQMFCCTPDGELAVLSNVSIRLKDDYGSERSTLIEMTTVIT